MNQATGKYDDIARLVMAETNADAIAIAVVGGNKGNGFSVGVDINAQDSKARLPNALRMVADVMDHENTHGEPVNQPNIVQDHLRWQYSMAAIENPGGIEDKLGEQIGNELAAFFETSDLSNQQKTEMVIDKAIERLAEQAKAA